MPGPTLDVALWGRAAALTSGASVVAAADASLDHAAPTYVPREPGPTVAGGVDPEALRPAVAGALLALAWRIEQALPQALAAAPQAWDRVDDLLTIFDQTLTSQIAEVRRMLERAAAAPSQASGAAAPETVRAMGIEGLLALEAACGLARLCERRLSSLIRLWVRSGEENLTPGGRPFLDLASALTEAARAWV